MRKFFASLFFWRMVMLTTSLVCIAIFSGLFSVMVPNKGNHLEGGTGQLHDIGLSTWSAVICVLAALCSLAVHKSWSASANFTGKLTLYVLAQSCNVLFVAGPVLFALQNYGIYFGLNVAISFTTLILAIYSAALDAERC